MKIPHLPAFIAAAVCVCAAAEPFSFAASRPNILLCIADDWSWPHAGAHGDAVVKTPAFDRVAREGALFNFAFCAAPSCTPSRGAILTGRAVHQLDEGGNLWGFLPKRFETYPEMLEARGYFVGLNGKGWGPGNFQAGGRTQNPAGKSFRSFAAFLDARPTSAPFCFWFGSQDPHRPYDRDSGVRSGMTPDKAQLHLFWPPAAEIHRDVLDYYFEVQRFDSNVAHALKLLDERGELENTVVIITSDNGMPFPRCKANLYDAGTRVPLAIRFPKKINAGQRTDAFVNLQDLAPTILEFAGVTPPREMVGRSLAGLLTGTERDSERDAVFLERERHANVRAGDLSYPARAIRTKDYLYIRNLKPERWPAGDPVMWKAVGEFGDCDASPTKNYILERRDDPGTKHFFNLCFALRPAEELYDLRRDPGQTNNVAGQSSVARTESQLRARLENWMRRTGDPRLDPADDRFEKAPYFGNTQRMPAAATVPPK